MPLIRLANPRTGRAAAGWWPGRKLRVIFFVQPGLKNRHTRVEALRGEGKFASGNEGNAVWRDETDSRYGWEFTGCD